MIDEYDWVDFCPTCDRIIIDEPFDEDARMCAACSGEEL